MDRKLQKLVDEGYASRRDGEPGEARRCFNNVIHLSREFGDGEAAVAALRGLAQLAADAGNVRGAIRSYREAVDAARAQSSPQLLAHTLRHLADLYRRSGQIEAAVPLYAETLSIYRSDVGTPKLQLANALRGAALNCELDGSCSRAAAHWQEAHTLYSESDIEAGIREAEEAIVRCGGQLLECPKRGQ